MDAATFSTALFHNVCVDLDISGVDPQSRFSFEPYLDDLGPRDTGLRSALSLASSLLKKSEVESSDDAESVTLLAFLEANAACKEWRLDTSCGPAVGYSVDYARSLLASWFEPRCGTDLELTMGSIEMAARFGPGRSIGLGRKPTQYYFKVGDSTMTAGSDFVRSWYELSVRHNPLCEAAEMARKARCGQIEIRRSGKLSFVPKSYSKRRIVVTEPCANTYFQLGAGAVFERVLQKNTGTDLSFQPDFNRSLAKKGSVDGSMATCDLKQCSDYIAMSLVAFMFPRSVTDWVSVLRTPSVDIPGLGTFDLHMASTMGNGFTFPLQTALLLAIVLGVYKTLDIKAERTYDLDSLGNYGVFGDDIVVVKEAFPLLCEVLGALGLIVNIDKSFYVGNFRESCGHDYFYGHNVRGVYCKRYPERVQDLFSIFNRLALWSARQNILLPDTLDYLRGLIGNKFQFVPPDEGIDGGILSPFSPNFADAKGVWKYNVHIPCPSALSVEPWSQVVGIVDSKRKDKSVKRWVSALLQHSDGSINEPAVLKALLYGGVRRGRIIFRTEDSVPYHEVSRETPRWGYSENPLVSEMTPVQVDRWMRSLLVFIDE